MRPPEVSIPSSAPGARLDPRWLALVALAVAQFMVFLDETVVNVALPSIKLSLGFSQAIHFSPDDANARYCEGRRDGLRMPSHLHLMRAIV